LFHRNFFRKVESAIQLPELYRCKVASEEVSLYLI